MFASGADGRASMDATSGTSRAAGAAAEWFSEHLATGGVVAARS
jgi:hypothetical protein